MTARSSVWSGLQLVEAFGFAAALLDRHRDRVNALNVFPVPDGDTGTNMALTMRAAIAAATDPPISAGDAAGKIAYGALMGARGNSGVILSQIFRGFASAIDGRDEIDGSDLARALGAAQTMAYKAVMRPVEGTMLTVIRGAAERAQRVSQRTPSLTTILREAVAGAQEALDSTPSLLEILRQAGVIDAGGQGVVYILSGLERYANGESLDDLGEHVNGDRPGAEMAFLDDIAELHGEDAFGYCTNFMVFGTGFDFDRCRAELAAMGESAVIVGDDSVIKVHIHTEHPGQVLDYATRLGDLDQIKIDNMSRQTDALTAQRSAAASSNGAAESDVAETGDQAIIAVAAGDGIASALRAMGATAIVPGGQSMNPSTEDLLKAVESQQSDAVLILPNNKNIILAANQVVALTEKAIHVVPTRSIPQGLAALAVFNADRPPDHNAREMEGALGSVRTVELTRAVRDVELKGVCVSEGQLIGLVDGELVASGRTIEEIAAKTLACLDSIDPELISIFTGADADEAASSGLLEVVASAFPDAEVESHSGGQPHYLFIVGIE